MINEPSELTAKPLQIGAASNKSLTRIWIVEKSEKKMFNCCVLMLARIRKRQRASQSLLKLCS